jgi:hypothetical protein
MRDSIRLAGLVAQLDISEGTMKWVYGLVRSTALECGGLDVLLSRPVRVVEHLNRTLCDRHATRLARFRALYYIFRAQKMEVPTEYREARSKAERMRRYERIAARDLANTTRPAVEPAASEGATRDASAS